MHLDSLSAISPIDGRYWQQASHLSPYFSEKGLIYFRTRVEIEYFIALCELPLPQLADFPKEKYNDLRKLYENFSIEDARQIKDIEKTTNHDIKALEYYIKSRMESLEVENFSEFIHFGLTSQDINNTAIPLSLKEGLEKEIKPVLNNLHQKLLNLASQWTSIPMLAYTHGQPASPTRLGKEIMVFCERLQKQLALLEQIPYAAKFGGATGNFNAHTVAYPHIDWVNFADYFVNTILGLSRSRYTTQIEHYDFLATLFDNLKRINTILIDLNRDMWQYISMGYFKQAIKKGEIGSSAMPHKVNPIDFENSEGNLGIANALLEHLSAKLPISRLQRDLTDSTVLRNIGVPLAHILIACQSLLKGLGKLEINVAKMSEDLENNWAVVAEGIQTILRREGYPKPYEALKELTRTNDKITFPAITNFINTLAVSDEVKEELRLITPFNYTGL
ncbi:adenylosuccinate lyase [Rhodocytophaga aerolata]|uniref:Adenylosuccinate lyase n=1 Tax=Rhodocytophaga aerolata TaxID=455078 RepID=A0ABT8R8K0_9BACT|nr:adenylosuccinate lyase [Rhodocytophaga aerolata]MDO1447593.1 adenylosuccinate lyase [Rhodocytophaga aerolata]